MANELINGKAYDWSQITATIGVTELKGVMAISYNVAQEKTNNYGAGSNPVSRGRGRKEPTASITVDMTEAEKIADGALDRDILNIAPFDITVTWDNAGKVVTHIIKNCEFTENPRELEEGATGTPVVLPLLPSHIIY